MALRGEGQAKWDKELKLRFAKSASFSEGSIA